MDARDFWKGCSGEVCVYTTLVGHYEALNEQPAARNSRVRFICLSDDRSLSSDTWEIRHVDPVFPLDPIRSQRDLKIRPHLWVPDFAYSLYIDNSIILKEPPEALFALFDPAAGCMIPRHSFRETLLDEFLEVIRLGHDDVNRIMEQLNHYLLNEPFLLDEKPWWNAILVRAHGHRAVRNMSETWASHVMRYSRRDQLSINYALNKAGVSPRELNIDNYDSPFHTGPVHHGRDRMNNFRDPAVSLMPHRARLRLLEQLTVERREQLAESRALAAERDASLAQIKALVADQEASLHRLEAVLAKRDGTIDELRAVILNREKSTERLEATIIERERSISQLRAEVMEQARRAEELQAVVGDAEWRLHSLHASRSWRITAPLRTAMRYVRAALVQIGSGRDPGGRGSSPRSSGMASRSDEQGGDRA
jgi:hypothetical protein